MITSRHLMIVPCVFLCLLPADSMPVADGKVPGLEGAIEIPFTMPFDGEATVALYNQDGRLLRTLAQVVPLTKGDHVIRWDGMDLWGNLLPAESDTIAKIFAGPGLRAKWEFAIASPNPLPWPTKSFGEGEALRAGGWLGDHGVSASAVAVGNRLFFGSTMAEHGHTVIFTNLEGDKMWGRGGLEGWVGPEILTSDGKAVFGIVKGTHLHRLELDGSKSAQIADTGKNKILAAAAHDGKVYLTMKNHEAAASLLASSPLTQREFDFASCMPRPSNAKAHNRNINEEEQFALTFSNGGHPQVGISPVGKGPLAGIVAKFKKPVAVGSLLVERMEIPVLAEFYILKSGSPFQAPEPGQVPGPEWELLVKSDLARRINVLSSPQAGITTEALYIRLQAQNPEGFGKWPRLRMCRILPRLMDRVDNGASIQPPPSVEPAAALAQVVPGDLAWSFRSTLPLTKETPANILIDLKKPTTFDGVVLLNCVNQTYAIDEWVGSDTPDPEVDKGWNELTIHDAGRDKLGGAAAAIAGCNDQRISLDRTVTTRALRIRLFAGMGSSRWGNPINVAEPSRAEAADIALLKLREGRPKLAETILQVRDGTTGELLRQSEDASVNMSALAFDNSGSLYSIRNNQLCRTLLPKGANEAAVHTVLHEKELKDPRSLAISPDGTRIAVGDFGAGTVFVFDKEGKIVTRIGGIGPRKRGPWDPHTIERPGAVAIDQKGKIWVCEKTYTPKRITRYSAEGKFEKEMLGPPHYGGGGYLDPNLQSFWYEAGEYEIDFARGTSRLKNLNDVQSDPATPTPEADSYSYTKVGRPVYLNGRRYMVGDQGLVVCRYDPGQTIWKPCAVLGIAQNSPFLVREDKPWRLHWLKQDLANSSFIWCDLNGDGQYQIEEVQLFKNKDVGLEKSPFGGSYWGSISGPDLTFWGRARLAPSKFTEQGVPVYEKEKIQVFEYEKNAPISMANYRANQAAMSGYSGASMVARDGSLVLMGQPYTVLPDLKIKGGPVAEKPSDFIPKIEGTILDNPLMFVGAVETKSDAGEVAMINGVNGRWFLWSVKDCVVLGEIFTGKKGGFGGLTDAPRGLDITDYKQDWETFFGYFTKALDGKYYVVAGRGHFGLSQVEGIDEIKTTSVPVKITPSLFEQNTQLRLKLAAAKSSSRKKEKRELTIDPLSKRVEAFKLDGDLKDWGDLTKFQKIPGEGNPGFSAAYDKENLVLAYKGVGGTGNAAEDWRYIFKTGFAFDLMIRTDSKTKENRPSAGDKRIVFAPLKGKWIAVLYDYVVPSADAAEGVSYTSPVANTRVDRVILLPENATKIAFAPGDKGNWSAEVQLSWASLGLSPSPGLKLAMDFGILSPDSGGLQVDQRNYWSNPDTNHVADLAVEAQIEPANWGTITLAP